MTPNRPFLPRALFPLLLVALAALSPKTDAAQAPVEMSAVVVAGVPVPAGMLPDQVRTFLAKELDSRLNTTVTLTDGVRVLGRTRRELGIALDLERMLEGVAAGQGYVPLQLTNDPIATMKALEQVADAFRHPPRNARPYMFARALHIRPGVHARDLNIVATADRIAQTVTTDPTIRRFPVALDKTPPAITTESLNGITGRLASFATTATSNANRNRNIEIAVSAIDGTLLAPGATFSLNQTVGRRTAERGFQPAIIFVNAEPVEGIGGGVSQVTGTLFNAAALAGLQIREVHPHSRPVAYLPPGRDATVAWGAKDLRFTNTTGAPVYIAYTFANRRLRATLFGRVSTDRKVTLTPRVQRRGPGHIAAQLYRIIRDREIVRKERLFAHIYRWEPES